MPALNQQGGGKKTTWCCDLPVEILWRSVNQICTIQNTLEERSCIYLGSEWAASFWRHQSTHLKRTTSEIFQSRSASRNPNWCLIQRLSSLPHARWPTRLVCLKSPYWNRETLQPDRKRDAQCGLWSYKVPYLYICHKSNSVNWPQTTGCGTQATRCGESHPTSENAVPIYGIWAWLQLHQRQRPANCWCP